MAGAAEVPTMSWRTEEQQPISTQEAFGKLTIDRLKPLLRLLTDDVPTRKGELVGALVSAMSRPEEVRALYEQLDELGKTAVQEAAHDPSGQLHRDRFVARYGRWPAFHNPPPKGKGGFQDEGLYSGFSDYSSYERPTTLRLFFPHSEQLPTDLRDLLLAFVPRPPEFTLPTLAEPPAAVPQTWTEWKNNRPVEKSEEVPLRLRDMAREALHDVRAVLRLVETGRVRVSDKKRQPTAASVQAVAAVLQGGDFYAADDQEEWKDDPAHDLAIKAFAWPMLLQAAGLAQKAGDKLELTPAGRKGLAQPPQQVLRAAYKKWRTSSLLDEFSRVETIKGQGRGGLSALSSRRKAVLDGLASCPANRWFAADDFFRYLRATDRDFVLAHRTDELYIAEHYYGSLGYQSAHEWEQLQGRYILAVLFEYAATLGLIDVAYVPPQGARPDYTDRWGTDDLSCLSRYDGLLYLRINPLGAWCLGMTEGYEPPAREAADVLRVLPNLDVVVKNPPLPPSDRLLLERFAEPQSDAVWKLTADRILPVLEAGGSLDELAEFLAQRGGDPLPQTVQVFLDDLRRGAGRLRDLGLARLIECADGPTAKMLAGDPQLRKTCRLAGERWLVFRVEDEAAVRRALRRLGHILPPPHE
jgi:hypothetical protein